MIPLGQSAEPVPPPLNQDIDSCKEMQRVSEMKHDYRAILWVTGSFWFSDILMGSCGLFLFFPGKAEVPVRKKVRNLKKAEKS